MMASIMNNMGRLYPPPLSYVEHSYYDKQFKDRTTGQRYLFNIVVIYYATKYLDLSEGHIFALSSN